MRVYEREVYECERKRIYFVIEILSLTPVRIFVIVILDAMGVVRGVCVSVLEVQDRYECNCIFVSMNVFMGVCQCICLFLSVVVYTIAVFLFVPVYHCLNPAENVDRFL